MTTFSDFGLAAPLLKALNEEGYESPTPIQAKAIPDVMSGHDLLGIAQTGTGKTAAFALPILHRLSNNPAAHQRRRCRVLVLSPTRELASQIAESFMAYGRHMRLTTTVVFGGVPLGKQERALAGGVDILVATPGRLLDLVDRRSLELGGVEILVLDEADQMLDLGFIHALRRVVTMIPKKRQTLFFSATMPKTIATLADQFLNDPVKVSVAPVATTAERVDQSVMFVSTGHKTALLRSLLEDPAIERTLVFARTKHGADRVVRQLEAAGVPASAIHGNKSQGQRERALADFKAGRCRVLIATDIAARGIDVEAVTHVINYDLPNVPESYVHRIGRTARAGAAGIAISFCNDEERAYLRDIERLTRLKVPVAPLPAGLAAMAAALPTPAPAPAPDPRSARGGHRDGQGRRPQGDHGRPAKPRSDGGKPGPRRHAGGGSAPAAAGRNGGQRQDGGRQQAARQDGGGSRAGEGQLGWLDRARRSPR